MRGLFGLTPGDAIALSSAVFAGLSALVAIAALLITLYIQFWRGARLFAWISQLTIIRVSLKQNNELLLHMLADDLLSGAPSEPARRLIAHDAGIRALVREGNREALVRTVSIQHLRLVNFMPTEEVIERYGVAGKIPVSFYATILISNHGGKSAHISNLVLIARPVGDPDRRWAFAAYMLMNLPAAIDPGADITDMQRFAGFFAGTSVGPGQSVKLDVCFVPHVQSAGLRLSEGGMSPGKYEIKLMGYRADSGKPTKAFSTAPFEYPFRDIYKHIFTGSEWAFLVHTEEEVLDAYRTFDTQS